MGKKHSQTPGWLVVVIAVVVLLGLFFGFGGYLSSTPEGKARIQERQAIEYCESEYTRLKEDPRIGRGALGIAYGACEQMKADYRRKWNREP